MENHLPENLFYNTPAAGVIVVLSKRKPASRKGKVVLVNASRRFTKGKPKNYLGERDITELAALFRAGKSVDGEVAVIGQASIEKADYNLSPARWVTRSNEQDHRSVKEIMVDLLQLDERAREIDSALAEMLVKL